MLRAIRASGYIWRRRITMWCRSYQNICKFDIVVWSAVKVGALHIRHKSYPLLDPTPHPTRISSVLIDSIPLKESDPRRSNNLQRSPEKWQENPLSICKHGAIQNVNSSRFQIRFVSTELTERFGRFHDHRGYERDNRRIESLSDILIRNLSGYR